MSATKRFGTLAILVVGLTATFIAVVAMVSAHGGDTGKIHSCVTTNSGSIRIVGASDSCKNRETALDWNGQGPPIYNYRSVEGEAGTAVQAFCNEGEKVTGGGGFSLDNSIGLVQNHPISDTSGVNAFGTTAIGWQVATEGFAAGATAFVICASAEY